MHLNAEDINPVMKPAGHFVFNCFVGSLSHGYLIHLPVFFNQNLEKMKLRIIIVTFSIGV